MTTSSTATASAQQLRLVHDILRDPLTDKHVMVPLTRKAFFSGKLAPEVDSNGKEQVMLKLTKEHYVMLERTEASNVLERRIESFAEACKPAKKKSSILSEERALAKVEATDDATSTGLPFFEIREELDGEGKEVKSEAINVVQELEYLQKRENEALNSVTRIPASIGVGGNVTHVIDDHNPSVSEDKFEQLSSRLDELARLEEESEANKKVNQRSANKLQGSGWSKGFLNANPTKKKSTPAEVPTKPVQHHISSSDFLAAKMTTATKKVGFRAENEIHEIPRIGERSASFFKKAEVQQAEPMAGASKPIGAEIFSGVIKERSVDKHPVGEKEPSERRSKPLSKFAQERLEQRR